MLDTSHSGLSAIKIIVDRSHSAHLLDGEGTAILTMATLQASICLYGDRITVDERIFHFDDTSAVVVLGKNKLNIYAGNEILQLKGSKRFNAVKYVNFFHRYQNIKTGDTYGKFLGF